MSKQGQLVNEITLESYGPSKVLKIDEYAVDELGKQDVLRDEVNLGVSYHRVLLLQLLVHDFQGEFANVIVR